MERRRLGRTGHDSTVAVLGGAAFWQSTPSEASAGFALAMERGVNHLDIAPQYGAAESVVGPLVPAVRGQLFVAGKTMRKNPDGVRAQFDDTRRLLGSDVLDLYQAHAVTSLADLEERSAALDVIVALRDSGATRFAGITGHDHGAPGAFLEALRRWDLDSVMFPVNPFLWGDSAYREDADALLAECARRDVAVQAIKAAARRPWSGDGADRWATTWYEPHRDPVAVAEGIRFALSVPGVHVICTPGDLGLLPVALDAAASYSPMSEAERSAAIDAARASARGETEIFPIPR
jgi:aryl-alcohol dehydrogenase-like predicted oxidoreductase